MPSSSTRSTIVELDLLYYYRIAHYRLWASYMSQEADFITHEFAAILDISDSDLVAHLKPTYKPEHCSIASYQADMKQWDDIQTANARMRKSNRICSAGTVLADVGALLFKVGRKEEATKFCEFGSALWQMSVEEHNREEVYNYGRQQAAGFDSEMS